MPTYRVVVPVKCSGEYIYVVDADDPASAIDRAKSGDCEVNDTDLACDQIDWDDAESTDVDE